MSVERERRVAEAIAIEMIVREQERDNVDRDVMERIVRDSRELAELYVEVDEDTPGT